MWDSWDIRLRSWLNWRFWKPHISAVPHQNFIKNFLITLLWHSPILANFMRSNVRTWKIWIVQASPWCVDPCSSGVDLQELKKFFCRWTKGGTSVNSFFQCGPPFDSRVEIFLSSWRSRPPEHGSTHHGEAWTIQIFHVLTFDLIKLAKIGLWVLQYTVMSNGLR